MKVHEIMTAHARCVAPDNTLVEAAGLMRELDVGVLPVCENERLAGMVTDRDIVLRGVADGRDAYNTIVRDVMSEGVFPVFADQEVEEAARIMEEKQVRRLPVLNREKRLVGILSLGDMAVNSNPAFSGEALREVSESPEEHMRGGLTGSSARSRAARGRTEEAPAGARRIPAGARGGAKKSETRGGRVASRRRTNRHPKTIGGADGTTEGRGRGAERTTGAARGARSAKAGKQGGRAKASTGGGASRRGRKAAARAAR